MQQPRVSVIGAGNAGQAIAADLIRRGHTVVAVYDKYEEAVRPIIARGGIELVGPVVSGFAPLTATHILDEAVGGAHVLIVAVPATAHAAVARDLARIIRANQTVVLCPGYIGGTLLFKSELQRQGLTALPFLVETTTMPFASRLVGQGLVGIKGIKNVLHVAALSSSANARAIELLQGVFQPALIAAKNVLEAGFNNPNPMSHVPLTVMNWGRIEGEVFSRHFDYHEWITQGIQRVASALDSERLTVMKALDLQPIAHKEFRALSYDSKWQIIEAKEELPASSWTIPPRFLDEDVPCGLVPISSLAKQLDVATPVTDALIGLASLARGKDFWREGRTAETLGLRGLSRGDIARLVA